MCFGCLLIKFGGFALFDSDSVFGTVPEAGAEPVTVDFTNQLCFAIDYFNCALGAGRDTLSTSIAFIFVNYNYV